MRFTRFIIKVVTRPQQSPQPHTHAGHRGSENVKSQHVRLGHVLPGR